MHPLLAIVNRQWHGYCFTYRSWHSYCSLQNTGIQIAFTKILAQLLKLGKIFLHTKIIPKTQSFSELPPIHYMRWNALRFFLEIFQGI